MLCVVCSCRRIAVLVHFQLVIQHEVPLAILAAARQGQDYLRSWDSLSELISFWSKITTPHANQ